MHLQIINPLKIIIKQEHCIIHMLMTHCYTVQFPLLISTRLHFITSDRYQNAELSQPKLTKKCNYMLCFLFVSFFEHIK